MEQEEIMDGLQVLSRLDKMAISISSFDDIDEERQFWFSKGALERLNAIELQRRMVYGIDRTTSRLQRFLETSELLQD
jgi:transposase